MTAAPGFRIRRLAGRCLNGYERDSGTRHHAVPSDSWRALCGAYPGKRSAGWSEWDEKEVTCPRCLKKLER